LLARSDAVYKISLSVTTSGTGVTNGNGDLNAGKTVTLTVKFSEVVTVHRETGVDVERWWNRDLYDAGTLGMRELKSHEKLLESLEAFVAPPIS
jgi:hypothetical protein